MPQFNLYLSTFIFHINQGHNVYMLSIKLSESLSCPKSWSNSACHRCQPKERLSVHVYIYIHTHTEVFFNIYENWDLVSACMYTWRVNSLQQWTQCMGSNNWGLESIYIYTYVCVYIGYTQRLNGKPLDLEVKLKPLGTRGIKLGFATVFQVPKYTGKYWMNFTKTIWMS